MAPACSLVLGRKVKDLLPHSFQRIHRHMKSLERVDGVPCRLMHCREILEPKVQQRTVLYI